MSNEPKLLETDQAAVIRGLLNQYQASNNAQAIEIANGSGVSQPWLSLFLGRKRGLGLDSAQKLYRYFEKRDLRLREALRAYLLDDYEGEGSHATTEQ